MARFNLQRLHGESACCASRKTRVQILSTQITTGHGGREAETGDLWSLLVNWSNQSQKVAWRSPVAWAGHGGTQEAE